MDAVESYGDDEAWKARKEAVKAIEGVGEAEAWKLTTNPEPNTLEPLLATAGADVDPLCVPLPEDSDAEDEEMEGASEELLMVNQLSEEHLVPADSNLAGRTESITLSDIENTTLPSTDADPSPKSTSPTHVAALETPLPHTPELEPFNHFRIVRHPQSDFTFPAQLGYPPGPSELAETQQRTPTRMRWSHSDDGLRKVWKEAVKTIERELKRLDVVKAGAWKRTTEPEPEALDPASITAGANIGPPPGEDGVDDNMEDSLEDLPTIDLPSEEPLSGVTHQTKLIVSPSFKWPNGVEPVPISTSHTRDSELSLHNAAPTQHP
ncbi:hypothetical protein FRC11_000889 [Ceratobasidium sp. 423]|nr:hypothetical protein FRC11_000889 [Ceratobasidium sp. 423]